MALYGSRARRLVTIGQFPVGSLIYSHGTSHLLLPVTSLTSRAMSQGNHDHYRPLPPLFLLFTSLREVAVYQKHRGEWGIKHGQLNYRGKSVKFPSSCDPLAQLQLQWVTVTGGFALPEELLPLRERGIRRTRKTLSNWDDRRRASAKSSLIGCFSGCLIA